MKFGGDNMKYIDTPDGKCFVKGLFTGLVVPSEEYLERQRILAEEEANKPKEPTMDDYLLDLDFRLSSIELGL